MIEVWKDVKGYEGIYKISNLGRVKTNKDRIRKGTVSHGYLRLLLWKDKQYKSTSIHRLVAENFIENPMNKPYVNHIDGDKQNNHVNNLEWCTQLENVQHSIRTGLKGENSKLHKLTRKDVEFIRKHYKPRDKTYSGKALSEQFNVSLREIYRVIAGDVF